MDKKKKKPPEAKSLFKLFSAENEKINKNHVVDFYSDRIQTKKNFYQVFDSKISTKLTPIDENLNFKKFKQDIYKHKLQNRIKRDFDFENLSFKDVDKSITPRLKSSKLRIYPNKDQLKLFGECFKVHEYYYNLTIDIINKHILDQNKDRNQNQNKCIFCEKETFPLYKTCKNHLHTTNKTLKLTVIDIRKELIIKDPDLKSNKLDWILNVPFDTREMAIRSAFASLKSAITNFKNGFIKKFNLSELDKNRISKIFMVDNKAIKKDNNGVYLFSNRLKKNKYLTFFRNKKFENEILSDVKIIKKNSKYYISIPCTEKFLDPKKKPHKFISLDPGERTFLTGFDNRNLIQFGSDTKEKILKYQDKIDRYTNLLKNKNSSNIKRKKRKLFNKITTTVDNMHNQISSHLCKTYENIILPIFETSKIVKKSENPHLNRNLNCLSHFKFKNKLKNLASKYNSRVFIVSESCTTMSCGKCGHLTKIGSSELYSCGSKNCNYNNISRDGNAARNIVMKMMLCHPGVTSPLRKG